MNQTEDKSQKYVSSRWRNDIIGTPAMIMAFGIFLLYPGRFLFKNIAGEETGESIIHTFSFLLCIFGLYVIYRFIEQAVKERTVMWNYTLDHIRIGTWVAGFNVLASVLFALETHVARILQIAGWILWTLYVYWLIRMMVRGEFKAGNLNGSIFLTTVATQSVVTGFVVVWPEQISDWTYILICINVIGVVFYWISFALVWVAGGIIGPLERWIPQNNITHGALSISMLAAQMLEEHIPGTLPYFHFVIQFAWVTTSLLIVSALVYEIYLFRVGKIDLQVFRMTNYARNFTYGMYFACTYYGYMYSHPSLMKSLLNPAALTFIACIVLAINVWELSHQVFTYRFLERRVV